MRKLKRLFSLLLTLCVLLSGCMSEQKDESRRIAERPQLPEKLEIDEDGIPMLEVFDAESEEIRRMNLEEYVTGVVAGEMKNDWPIEALKAQAILARTFVLKFCDTKQSRYSGADISTDIEEAQAYAPGKVNDQIRRAIQETEGMIMSADGEYPHAWFYAHAGGMTELPSVALDFKDEDPNYLSVTESPDSDKAPEDVKNWTVSFTTEEVRKACSKAGLKVNRIDSVEIGEKGESGRAKTLKINGDAVSAPSFRIAIGASKLKSTLIDDIEIGNNTVTFTGHGYGHGVGMSQWGAYALAEEGKSAEEIIRHYFKEIDIVKMW